MLLNLKKIVTKLNSHYLSQVGGLGIFEIKYFLFVRSGKLTFSKGFWVAEFEKKNITKLNSHYLSQGE